jgi:hypothetical protein
MYIQPRITNKQAAEPVAFFIGRYCTLGGTVLQGPRALYPYHRCLTRALRVSLFSYFFPYWWWRGWAGPLLPLVYVFRSLTFRGEGHFRYVNDRQNLRPVLAKFRTFLNLASPKHPPCCFKCKQGLYLCKFQNVARVPRSLKHATKN